jgi:hypothetical protein
MTTGKDPMSNRSATPLDWRKATASQANGCVEVAPLPGGGVALRDSKLGEGSPVLRFSRHEWTSFLDGIEKSEFDHLI